MVIAIIGILASVVLALFSQPRANSRDARREADIKEIRNGLDLYANTTGFYPQCTTLAPINGNDCLSTKLREEQAMSAVPRDPQNIGNCNGDNQSFVYCYQSDQSGTTYELHYHLETNSIRSAGWQVISP